MSTVDDTATTITILVVSNHAMFARGLENLLNRNPQFQILGQETTVAEAIEQIKNLYPDVVILDSTGTSPKKAGLKQILQAGGDTGVIDLSLTNNDLCIYQASQKTVKSVRDLLAAIKQAAAKDS
jgi:DNA-binding NarL/FixJ family response regulator